MAHKKRRTAYFKYNSEEGTHVVKGSAGKQVVLTHEDFPFHNIAPVPKIPEYAKKLKLSLETVLEEHLSQLPEGFKLQSGRDLGNHVRNALDYQQVTQAKEFLEKLKSSFELVDLKFIYAPKNGIYVIEEGITKKKYPTISYKALRLLKKKVKEIPKDEKHNKKILPVSRGVWFIKKGYRREKLSDKEFKSNPIVLAVVKTKKNADAIVRYAKERKKPLSTYVWVPDVNKLEKPLVCIVRIGGDSYNKFVIEAGHHNPSVKTVIRGVKIKKKKYRGVKKR